MSTVIGSKINQLLQSMPSGTVVLSSWLKERGYSLDLQRRYRQSNWLESFGTGAMIRTGDQVSYEGALYALQRQAMMSVHPGGRSALSLQGKAQYIDMSSRKVVLFGAKDEKLPSWFRNYPWEFTLEYYRSAFLPADKGLIELNSGNFNYMASGPARALLECLYLVPERQSLMECYEIMEGLNNLRPTVVQALLEGCSSVKVNRLFLYLAEKAEHEWLNYLQTAKIDLGKGKRSIIKGGAYNTKYQITVSTELERGL